MPWCPNCKTEYDPPMAMCADCGAALVESLQKPKREPGHDPGSPPVMVRHSLPGVEAQIAAATLQAQGIPTYLQPSSEAHSYVDVIDNIGRRLDLFVPAAAAETALAILDAIDRERDREKLLRPASGKDIEAERLLRPARNASKIDLRKLLRPRSAEDRKRK